MNALSELPSDITTPLGGPDVLYWFDALVDRRCTLAEFDAALVETCRDDPEAAKQALLLLDHHANTGKLRIDDLRPLELQLQRLALGQPVSPPASSDDEGTARPPAAPAREPVREIEPTRAFEIEPTRAFEIEPTRAFVPPTSGEDKRLHDIEIEVTRAFAAASEEDHELFQDLLASESIDGTAPSGRVLRGRYVLQDELGIGGMGTVYRAIDRNRAGLPYKQQYIAIKVLREEFASRPQTLQTLQREFHQAQSLSHPGIVNVFDLDQDDGTYFVTMELLDGEPLSALLRRVLPNKLAREPALRILRELGEAIAYAHARDVMHLDLKPGNVMITLQGHVRVLDFGLAQTYMSEPWISEAAPAFNAATPAYASCERLAGELPDVRDDIFSYACIAYELLSGRHPFDRQSAVHARKEGRKPRRIKSLPRSQWRTLQRGLAWNREDRPASMLELLEGLGLQESTPWTPSASMRMRPRRRVRSSGWFVAAGLVVLAVLGYAGWTRLPEDYRDLVIQRTFAWGEALAETTDDARTWADDARTWAVTQYATWREGETNVAPAVDQNAAPTSVAEPAPRRENPTPERSAGIPPTEAAATGSEATPTGSTQGAPDALPPAAASSPSAAAETASTNGAAGPVTGTGPPNQDETATVADPRTTQVPTRATGAKAGGGPGELGFAASTYTVSESTSMARLTVRRRGGARGEISFGWHTVDGSAAGGEDYAAHGGGREVMAAGQTTTTLLVPLVEDSVAEHTELFDVVIEKPGGGASLGAITRVPVIIVDDD